MDTKKLLYRSHKRWKIFVICFMVFASLPFLVIPISMIENLIEGRNMIEFNRGTLTITFGILAYGLMIFYFCYSIKKGLKRAKPKIDYMYGCIEKLNPMQKETIKMESNEFFRGFASRTQLNFGHDCLYGRIVSNGDWKDSGDRYHVILPYKHIKQVILHISAEKNLKATLTDALSTASAVLSVAGMLVGAGGAFFFTNRHALFVIEDDRGNYHRMSCGSPSPRTNDKLANYVKEIIHKAPNVQIGYVD